MNRRERRIAAAYARKAKGPLAIPNFLLNLCDNSHNTPLSPSEMALSDEIVGWLQSTRPIWYHGGLRGRSVGDLLLPPSETGSDPRDEGDRYLWRKDFVYITPDMTVAAEYAGGCDGLVYRVRPLGEVRVDPTSLRRHQVVYTHFKRKVRDHFHEFNEFACRRAEVLGVVF